MKKLLMVLLVIGMILGSLDIDNMLIFVLSKILGILFIAPVCLIYGEE